MSFKHMLPITEARKKIFDIADEVQRPGAYYTLTENGRPKVVMLSAEEFESYVETVEAMLDWPNLAKDIAEAEADYQAGRYVTLDELLAKEGFVLADKKKSKYAIPSRRAKKGTKKSK